MASLSEIDAVKKAMETGEFGELERGKAERSLKRLQKDDPTIQPNDEFVRLFLALKNPYQIQFNLVVPQESVRTNMLEWMHVHVKAWACPCTPVPEACFQGLESWFW